MFTYQFVNGEILVDQSTYTPVLKKSGKLTNVSTLVIVRHSPQPQALPHKQETHDGKSIKR